jgi:electron transport complex protein RnfG
MSQSKVYMVLSLVVICLISAFALAQVYTLTKAKIEQAKIEAVKNALSQVLPNAISFEEKESSRVWFGYDKNGNKVGIVFQVMPRGYGGPIGTLVGVDSTGKITGLRIASPAEGLKETAGLGLRVREDWFRNQFINKTKNELRLKKDGGTIDAITAATISSRAVTNGVREGLERYKKYWSNDSTSPNE